MTSEQASSEPGPERPHLAPAGPEGSEPALSATTPPTSPPQSPSPASYPSAPLYLFATFSLILPWFGVLLLAWGGYELAAGPGAAPHNSFGWMLVASGVGCIILDILIDVVWAHPSLSLTDQPTLNRPAAAFVGRQAIVTEAIVDGRGKVLIGDTQWLAEGPDASRGETVRIVGARDTALLIARETPPQ